MEGCFIHEIFETFRVRSDNAYFEKNMAGIFSLKGRIYKKYFMPLQTVFGVAYVSVV